MDTQAKNDIDQNLRIMDVVEKELELQKSEAIFSLTIFMSTMSIWILLVALWEKLGKPIPVKRMTVGVEIIALLMFVFILKFTRIRISEMGITKKNLGRALIRSGIISTGLIIVVLGVKFFIKQDDLFFHWEKFDIRYLLTSILQEFISRGFLLTTLNKINTTKNAKHISVICSSLYFSCVHLYYGFSFMIGAGILSIILGYLYLKDENIWGVSLMHFVCGSMGVILLF